MSQKTTDQNTTDQKTMDQKTTASAPLVPKTTASAPLVQATPRKKETPGAIAKQKQMRRDVYRLLRNWGYEKLYTSGMTLDDAHEVISRAGARKRASNTSSEEDDYRPPALHRRNVPGKCTCGGHNNAAQAFLGNVQLTHLASSCYYDLTAYGWDYTEKHPETFGDIHPGNRAGALMNLTYSNR